MFLRGVKMEKEDFNLSDGEVIYFGRVGNEVPMYKKEAGQKVLNVLQELNCSDWLTKTIMSVEYLWEYVLTEEAQENLRRWMSENDDITVYRLLDD